MGSSLFQNTDLTVAGGAMRFCDVMIGSAGATRVAVVVVAILGLLYRATLYWLIPVAPDEPYGLGDIVDLLFYFLLFGICALCLSLGFVLSVVPAWKKGRYGVLTAATGIISFAAYYILHPLMPQLIG